MSTTVAAAVLDRPRTTRRRPAPAPRTIKALSVKPFWAGLIELGEKSVEIRSRHTRHRGPLLICTSKRPRDASVPAGVTLCIVDVVDSRPMRPTDEAASGVAYDPSLFAWVLANPLPVERVPVRGQLGFFDVRMPG